MDLELSGDQELFRDTTRQFLSAQAPVTAVRSWADSPAGFDPDWWTRGAQLGWTSLLVSEERGGGSISGRGLCDLALVLEEMGALVSPGPIIPVNIVAQAVASDGTDEQAARVLPGLLDGTDVAAWCFAEPGHLPIAEHMNLSVRSDGDGFVIDGMKSPVEAGAQARWLLVTAPTSRGVSQFLVDASAPGVEISPLNGLDLVRRHARVKFNGLRVSASDVIGALGDAGDAVERQLETVLVLQCAETVGATEKVFGFTVEYASNRYSFGRPLTSYQALKHRFADMKVWLESAHAITVEATQAVEEGSADAPELARIAKAYVSERCPEIIQDCIQMHGGIAVTWDHDIHLYLRRVILHRQTFGDPSFHRDAVGAMAAS